MYKNSNATLSRDLPHFEIDIFSFAMLEYPKKLKRLKVDLNWNVLTEKGFEMGISGSGIEIEIEFKEWI